MCCHFQLECNVAFRPTEISVIVQQQAGVKAYGAISMTADSRSATNTICTSAVLGVML